MSGNPPPNMPPPPPVCCISFMRRINSGWVIIKGAASLSIASNLTVYCSFGTTLSIMGLSASFCSSESFDNCGSSLTISLSMWSLSTRTNPSLSSSCSNFCNKCPTMGESSNSTVYPLAFAASM